MDKLQWWWRIGAREEALLGEGGCEARRQKEIERFTRHVERWLANHGRCLYGTGPFPCLGSLASNGDLERSGLAGHGGTASAAAGSTAAAPGPDTAGHPEPLREKVANG